MRYLRAIPKTEEVRAVWLLVITVYIPRPPKWIDPKTRGGRKKLESFIITEIVIFAGERLKRRSLRLNSGGKENFILWRESRQGFVSSAVKNTSLLRYLRPSIDLSKKGM